MSELADKLETLATKLADSALSDNTLAHDRMEIFKLLTTYHLGVSKVSKPKDPNDEPQGETFDGFRNRVAATAGGTGPDRPFNGDASTIDIPSDLAASLRPLA